MIKIAFIDLETTGLPKTINFDEYHSYDKLKYYDRSRIVQIAVIICEYKLKDFSKKIIAEHNYIIKPDGFSIGNSHIHGITEEKATQNGIVFVDAINNVMKDIINCDVLVAHNILFDKNILLSELFRYKLNEYIYKINSMKIFCTSKECTGITKIRYNFLEYKQPKLSELYEYLFGKKAVNLHNALNDTKILLDCFDALLVKKLINISPDGKICVV